MKDQNSVLDVRVEGESADVEDILRFAGESAVDALFGVVQGVLNTGGDLVKGGTELYQGDWTSAKNRVKTRINAVVDGSVETLESASALVKAGYESVVNDEAFITDTNKAHLTRVLCAGFYVVATDALTNDSTH